MLDGAYDNAIQHFTAALDLKPGLIHALISRGFCYLTLGDEESARRDFAEVIAKDAGFNRNVYVLIALCFKRSGDYVTAIRYLSRCVAQFPSFRPALVARGELQLKIRDYDKARADFRQVLADSPQHLVARRGLGDACRGLGSFREAMRHYSQAIDGALQALSGPPDTSGGDDGSGSDNGSDSSSKGPSIVEVAQDASRSDPLAIEHGSDLSSPPGLEAGQEAGPGSDAQAGLDGLPLVKDEPVQSREQLEAFLAEALTRRALLARLAGDLESAGTDLLEVLQLDARNGLALLLYAKLLIEQHRHREAPDFLLASIQQNLDTGFQAHALLGTLLMTRQDPDCNAALRHLKEASRLNPSSQPVRATYWICAAMAALHDEPHDARRAIGLLDSAFQILKPPDGDGEKGALVLTSATSGGRSARSAVQRGHAAGRGGVAAAAILTSPEDTTWLAAKVVVQRRQELAQSDDLEKALECSHYLQLVAREPAQQSAPIPPLLHALKAMACMELARWDDAVTECRRALAIDPEDKSSQYNMHIAGGILRSSVSEYEAAVGKITKAVRLRPVAGEARVHRAVALVGAARKAAMAGMGSAHTGSRAKPLLGDALADLDAAEQQAEISGELVPPGARRLRAACLCGLGRFDEAFDMLRNPESTACGAHSPRRGALAAQALAAGGRHQQAIDSCNALLEMEGSAAMRADAFMLRGRCWSELDEAESAFEDFREALILAPHRADVHAASGELYLAHGCPNEALTAFNTAGKLMGNLAPKLAYERALAHLSLGAASSAAKDFGRALRMSPGNQAAARARDGVLALQMAAEGEFRHAHVRLNALLHTQVPANAAFGLDGGPALFLPHELVLYRGVCSLYLGEPNAAAHDFESAREVINQASSGTPDSDLGRSDTRSARGKLRRRPLVPLEVATEEGRERFECEILYNVGLCHLMGKDYRAALDAYELLLANPALDALGAQGQCLAWFLVGVCRLALGESPGEVVREAFMRSYAHDACYVDDFLRRHELELGRVAGGMTASVAPSRPEGVGRQGVPFRPLGGPPRRRPTQACDAAPAAVCCFRRGGLSSRLPPCKLQVRDVIVWARPSIGWPFARPPDLSPQLSLAWLDMCQHHEVGVSACPPWDP